MGKMFSRKSRIRRVSLDTANRYIRRFGGKVEDEGVTWAGEGSYHAVWQIDLLTNAEGIFIAEVV